jgi:hypothetical protein
VTTKSRFMDWLWGWINEFDGALLSFVYRRRGISFIYYFTNPDEWEAYMAQPCDRPHVDGLYTEGDME